MLAKLEQIARINRIAHVKHITIKQLYSTSQEIMTASSQNSGHEKMKLTV